MSQPKSPKSQGGCVSSGQAGLPGPTLHRPLLAPVRSVCKDWGKRGADTQKNRCHPVHFFRVYFLLVFFFSVKCPSSSITYKHDLY